MIVRQGGYNQRERMEKNRSFTDSERNSGKIEKKEDCFHGRLV